jgi:pyrroloquinoline quinone biosynthesis protein B
MHACLAVSAAGNHWYLLNATPDVRFQIESFPQLYPGPGPRQTPVRGVLLTDAELDHTLGLLILREGASLEVLATTTVLAALSKAFPVRHILHSYAPFRWQEVKPGEAFLLDEGRIRVQGFRLGLKQPRYVTSSKMDGDWVIGYRFKDLASGGVAVYAPAIEAWTHELDAQLSGAQCAFIDGTFWTDDEMIQIGASGLTAREMGHLKISGAGGSAERLAALPIPRRVYVHVNNTNPILDDESPESRLLTSLGIEVGWDGMEMEV